MTDLAAQLRALADRVGDLEPAAVAGELERLRFVLWQGATATAPAAATPTLPGREDGLLDVAAAAALLGRSPSWLRKHGRALPGYCQPTGPKGRVRWSRAALRAWRDGLASHT